MILMSIAREIENVIREKGYNLLVCSTENDQELEKKYIESLISRKISGIILHSTGTLDDYIARISQEIPIALVYRHVEHGSFIGDTVDTNAGTGNTHSDPASDRGGTQTHRHNQRVYAVQYQPRPLEGICLRDAGGGSSCYRGVYL